MSNAPGRDLVEVLRTIARSGGRDPSFEAVAAVLEAEGLGRCSPSSLARCGRGLGRGPSGPDALFRTALQRLAGDQTVAEPLLDEAVQLRRLITDTAPRTSRASESVNRATRSDYAPTDPARRVEAVRFADDLRAVVLARTGRADSARQLGRYASMGSDQARGVCNGELVLPPDRLERIVALHTEGRSEISGDLRALVQRYLSEIAPMLDDGAWGPSLLRLSALGADPPPEPEHGYTPDLPRIVGREVEALGAQVLPERPRLATVERGLRKCQDTGTAIRFLVGEGGLGKSVLLGQLIAAIDAGDAGQPWQSALLISCPSVVLGASPTRDDVAAAVAQAADLVADGGVGDVLDRLERTFGRTVLLLDALDVLLADTTFGALAGFLGAIATSFDVVVTCRQDEFNNYFGDLRASAPALLGRVHDIALPPLTAVEIVDWARAYLESEGPLGPDQEGFLVSLADGVERVRPLQQVCAVPLRLALTCRLFSEQGRVPEDLTVTGLYQRYWRARVRTHEGRAGTAEATAKEEAALAVAAWVVNETGGFVMRVPRGLVGAGHRTGIRRLTSEGVLREFENGWEFFHQTFAEFAHGRFLLTRPADDPGVNVLLGGVRSGRRPLWAVVKSLLLQTDDPERRRTMSDALPSDDPEGARILAVVALNGDCDDLVQTALRRAATRDETISAVLPVLEDAPRRHLDAAVDWTLRLVRSAAPTAVDATVTLAVLLSRLPPDQLRNRFAAALDAVLAARPLMNADRWSALPAALLGEVLLQAVDGPVLDEVWIRYPALDGAGRQPALRHVLNSSDTDIAAAARAALRQRCPPLLDVEKLQFLELCWESATVRAEMGWESWTDLATAALPKGWATAQIHLLAAWADADDGFLARLLADMMEGLPEIDADRRGATGALLVNVVLLLVPEHGDRIVDRLLVTSPPRSGFAFGAIADCAAAFAKWVDGDRRRRLDAWLSRTGDAAPARSWPARVVLAGDDVDLHRSMAAQLHGEDVPAEVVGRAVDAWLFNIDPEVLNDFSEDLRPLLAARSGPAQCGRLAGLLVAFDEGARDRVTDLLLSNGAPDVASTAIVGARTSLLTRLPLDANTARWFAGLLASPHADAVQKVGDALLEESFVAAGTLADAVDVSLIVKRTEEAVDRAHDAVCLDRLLELAIKIDRVRALSASTVEQLFDSHRRRLPVALSELTPPASSDQSSAVRHFARLCRTLGMQRLAPERNRALASGLLAELDLSVFGEANKKIRKSVSGLLVDFLKRDPTSSTWLDDLFDAATTSDGVKLAIADAALVVDRTTGSARARRLKDRPSCPRVVLAHLLKSLEMP